METNFYKGRLKRWNEDRGFGFIGSKNEKRDIFIHISALKGMSRRPVVGDIIQYQIRTEKDGKSRAVNASIEGVAEIEFRTRRKKPKNQNSVKKWFSKLLIISLLILIGVAFYNEFSKKNNYFETTEKLIMSMPLVQDNQVNYSCNGKVYCSEMTSCEEAKFYQNNCPRTKMDGDGDGIPCERQWCSW